MDDQGLGLWNQAQQEYPALKGLGLSYKYNPGAGPGFLESWPADETGTPEHPRPPEFPLGQQGMEVYNPKTRPIDLMGDAASHFMINSDPTIAQHYKTFQQSLEPWQHTNLQDQYNFEKQFSGEDRPYEDWLQRSGLPAYFRGYAFDQWPNAHEMYTPQQLQNFDSMMRFLREPK